MLWVYNPGHGIGIDIAGNIINITDYIPLMDQPANQVIFFSNNYNDRFVIDFNSLTNRIYPSNRVLIHFDVAAHINTSGTVQ